MRYTLLLNESGGILDDLMATRIRRRADARRQRFAQGGRSGASAAELGPGITIEPQFERALLALQGPVAAAVLARLADRRGRAHESS